MMTKKIACMASTALVGCLLSATAAMAQSTGTDAVEQVVVTASSLKNQNGAIVQQVVPKSRSTITQDFIARQVPGQTVLDSLNLLPGVNFTNNDAYGSAVGLSTSGVPRLTSTLEISSESICWFG